MALPKGSPRPRTTASICRARSGASPVSERIPPCTTMPRTSSSRRSRPAAKSAGSCTTRLVRQGPRDGAMTPLSSTTPCAGPRLMVMRVRLRGPPVTATLTTR